MILACKYYFPLVVLILIAFISAFVVNVLDKPVCHKMFGFNFAYIGLVQYFFLYPLICVVVSIYMFLIAVKSYKSGIFPPKGVPLLQGLRTITGFKKNCLIVTLGFTPFVGAFLLFAGVYSYNVTLQNMDVKSFQNKMEINCWYKAE